VRQPEDTARYAERLSGPKIVTDDARIHPLVSIITPAYNRAAYLTETIDSILSQDYPRIEYIVLDDGSTDGTPGVLARYGSRIRWETHPNMGETRTVNRGFALARGDIVAVVNSDDPLLPGAVAEAVAFLEAHPDILVAYPDWNLIDHDSKLIEHIQVHEYDYLYVMKRHRCIVGPGAFVRRRAIELAGLRDPSFKYVADFDFWLRVGLHGPFARIPRTLATFRVHPDSASESCRGREMAEEHIRLLEQFFSLPNLPAAVHQAKDEAFSWAHHVAGIAAGKARRTAWEHIVKAVRYYPRGILSQWTLIAAIALPNRLLQRLRQARRKIRSVLKKLRGAVRWTLKRQGGEA
jgi:glycosyltransferase involved in cell wall biosynthesis